MKIHQINQTQFKRLKPLVLSKEITSIESDLYVLPDKQNGNKQLLKYYKKNDGKYFGNKLLTINSLIENKDEIGIEELIFPRRLAIVNKKLVGFTMDYIENNVNLTTLLNSSIPTRDKVAFLKQIQKIITKIQYINKEKNFYLADIHESNFILNNDNNKIYVVDLDGCKISNNEIYTMKYGSFNEKLFNHPHKYPLDENENPLPSNNTEWYCFITMVLNMLSSGPSYKLLLEDFYGYLCFLRSKKIPNELLSCFYNLYTGVDNYMSIEMLDLIPNDISDISLNNFLVKTKKQKFYQDYYK